MPDPGRPAGRWERRRNIRRTAAVVGDVMRLLMRLSRRSTPTPALLLAVALATLPAALAPPSAAAAEVSPWQTLDRLRDALVEQGPARAGFRQTYVPAGFSTGETERGTLYLALPECMRWDYSEPYEKTFLLCGDEAHYWNPEDRSGRRYEVDREKEPGLDLLMLSLDTLRQRYRARAEAAGEGLVRVTLEPISSAGSLAEATLLVDPKAGRLAGLSYRDREGNRTKFELEEPAVLAGRNKVFQPPADFRWETGEP